MANSLTSNPWVIDTPGAAVLFTTNVLVSHIEFALYSTQGDQVLVKDRFGKVIWAASGAADLQEVRSGNIGWIYGLAVSTLDSGMVRIYYK